MTYSITDLDKAVYDRYCDEYISDDYDEDDDPRDVWGLFYRDLLQHEAVKLPGINGSAWLIDADVESKDYWNEGEIWFVFGVSAFGAVATNYRRSGYHSSYDGRCFDGPTEEVIGKQVLKWDWSAK